MLHGALLDTNIATQEGLVRRKVKLSYVDIL